MNDKTVIVTGANSGMGLASSAELARQGAYVIMACRNKERGQQALEQAKRISGSDRLELAICDLQSLDSVRGFVAWFQEHYPVLDVLLNNAGIVSLKRQITPHGFEAHMGIKPSGTFFAYHAAARAAKGIRAGEDCERFFRGLQNRQDSLRRYYTGARLQRG